MHRLYPVLLCCLARAAAAQTPLSASEADSYQPQNVDVRSDGRCMTVRPGDTVHYTLTIEGVGAAAGVYGDLQLRTGRFHEPFSRNLPVPDFRSLGGGGFGVRDSSDAKSYRFAFRVPKEIYGGTYRGVGVNVRAEQPQSAARAVSYYPGGDERAPKVDVSWHTRDEIHRYCLNVVSSFGVATHVRPLVTKFEPGAVDPMPPAAASPKPLSPVRPLPPPSLDPPPQPR